MFSSCHDAPHVGAMFAAGCWHRDGIGTPVDPVQALRWYFTMRDHGGGDGSHQAIQLARSGMTDEQIRQAARLAARWRGRFYGLGIRRAATSA
jgi:uncharacterized protein